MRTTKRNSNKVVRHAGLHAIVFLFAMFTIAGNATHALAEGIVPAEVRLGIAGDKFENTVQAAVVYKMRPPRRLRARYLELAVGVITTSNENRPFVSLGPVWQLPIPGASDRWFISLGLSPTVIAGSTFNGRDLGGNFHFTSSATVGAVIDEQHNFSIAFRIQHISNGGIDDTNPGMDMVGINVSYDFGQ